MQSGYLTSFFLLFYSILTGGESSLLDHVLQTFSPEQKGSTGGFVYQSYQSGIVCNASSRIKVPRNFGEVQMIVRKAITSGKTVKAVGSLHSLTDVICTEGIPISMKRIKHTIDHENGTATFGAGIELIDAMTFLEMMGKTLLAVPTFAGITLGGAIGTGAHGSSLLHTTMLSDQLVGVTIVDGLGNLRRITDSEELKAFRVNLGLLAIIVEVTLQTVPLFKMRVENKVESDKILFDGTALSWAREYDWFQMWWFPSYNEVVVSRGNYTDASVPGNARTNLIPDINPLVLTTFSAVLETLQMTRNGFGEALIEKYNELSLFKSVIGKPPIFTEDGSILTNPATGYAWRLQTNKCTDVCSWQNGKTSSIFPEEPSMAFALSDSNFINVMTEIRSILNQSSVHFYLNGIFIRFAKASEALMAVMSERDSFILEWPTAKRLDPYNTAKHGIAAHQQMQQSLLKNFDGRPHWGKNGLHYFTQKVLRSSLQNRGKFISAMRTYDPNGIFLNKFGRRILGISDAQDVDPKVTHCALQDYCICKAASDCAFLQDCVDVNGSKVCKDLVSIPVPLLEQISLPDVPFLDPRNLTNVLQLVKGLM